MLAVGLRLPEITSDEYLVALTAVVDQSDTIAHAVLHDHRLGDGCRLLDILTGSRRHISEDQLLGYTPAQCHLDMLQHLLLGIEHIVRGRQRHGKSRRSAARRYDRYGMHRIHHRQVVEQYRMSRLVICRDALVALRHDLALLLRADTDLDK